MVGATQVRRVRGPLIALDAGGGITTMNTAGTNVTFVTRGAESSWQPISIRNHAARRG